MVRLGLTPSLTAGYSETLEHQIRTTHAGQAHWANTAMRRRNSRPRVTWRCTATNTWTISTIGKTSLSPTW